HPDGPPREHVVCGTIPADGHTVCGQFGQSVSRRKSLSLQLRWCSSHIPFHSAVPRVFPNSVKSENDRTILVEPRHSTSGDAKFVRLWDVCRNLSHPHLERH